MVDVFERGKQGRIPMPKTWEAAIDKCLRGTIQGVHYPTTRYAGKDAVSYAERVHEFVAQMPDEAMECLAITALELADEGDLTGAKHWQQLADDLAEYLEGGITDTDPWDVLREDTREPKPTDDTREPKPTGKSPGRPVKSEEDKHQPKARTEAEIDRFFAAINRRSQSGCRFYAIAKMLQYTGMRIGELIDLEMSDIDWHAGMIRVLDAKTDAGCRDVLMPKGEHREELQAAMDKYLALRATWEPSVPNVFVVRPDAGKIADKKMDYQNIAKSFQRISKRAGITRTITAHQLRHTYVSRLLAHGAPVTGVSKQVGHKHSDITLRIYSWAVNKEQRDAVDKF